MGCFSYLLQLIYVFTFCSIFSGTKALEKPSDVSADIYCNGCGLTVKELHSILSHPMSRGIEEMVDNALKEVCKTANFNKQEMNSKTVLKICKHIRNDERLKPALLTEYTKLHNQRRKGTYLEMTQKICSEALEICPKADLLKGDNKDGGIVFDEETQEFKVEPGRKVKIAKSVDPAKERMEMFKDLKDLPEDERLLKMKEHHHRIEQDRKERINKFRDMSEEERAEKYKELKDLPPHERGDKIREMHMARQGHHGFKPPRHGHLNDEL